jgi:hypothetical protein
MNKKIGGGKPLSREEGEIFAANFYKNIELQLFLIWSQSCGRNYLNFHR